MKDLIIGISLSAVALFMIALGIRANNEAEDRQHYEVTRAIAKENAKQSAVRELMEFEQTRDSLYDAAYTICQTLIIDRESDYYYDLDDEYIYTLKTYRVPSLSILLETIDEIERNGHELADILDLDALSQYDTMREKYESFYTKRLNK